MKKIINRPITERQMKKATEQNKARSLLRRAEQNRASRLKLKYNMTLAEYESLFNKQNGTCAVCKQSSDRLLVVDHDHNTGHVRGLLCHMCNVGLGMLGDSIESLQNALVYLQSADTKTR